MILRKKSSFMLTSAISITIRQAMFQNLQIINLTSQEIITGHKVAISLPESLRLQP